MRVIAVKYVLDYELEVTFANGKVKVIDFLPFLKKEVNSMSTQFIRKNKFKQVSVDSGFLSWGNGDMEISAEMLAKM